MLYKKSFQNVDKFLTVHKNDLHSNLGPIIFIFVIIAKLFCDKKVLNSGQWTVSIILFTPMSIGGEKDHEHF